MLKTQTNVKRILALLLFFSCLVLLGYFTAREEIVKVILLFTVMFGCYWVLLKDDLSIKWIIFSAIFLRLSQLFMLPNLSDDYFRFIWDGQLMLNGINPFYRLPSYYIQLSELPQGLTQYLYDNLNSPEYYTVYPPICQFIFGLAALIGGKHILLNVIVMRLFIILAEVATLFFIPKILEPLNIHPSKLKWYAYNPLVIVELTGNLHFEALMICFLCLSVYLLLRQKLVFAALAFSFSIGTKLLPLMFLPILLFSYLGWQKVIKFYFTILIGITALFITFIDLDMIQHMGESIKLYFKRFEFNASIYYVVRWIGYQVKGYNIIGTAGVRLTFVPIILITILSLFKTRNVQELLLKMLFTLSVYFFTATIVHPWYISTLVFISIFTNYSYAVVWSALAILSYTTYRNADYEEILLLTFVEYIIVYILFVKEIFKYVKGASLFRGRFNA